MYGHLFLGGLLRHPQDTKKNWELVGVATGVSWKGPFTLNSPDPVTPGDPLCIAGRDEDPFLWQSARGGFFWFLLACFFVFFFITLFRWYGPGDVRETCRSLRSRGGIHCCYRLNEVGYTVMGWLIFTCRQVSDTATIRTRTWMARPPATLHTILPYHVIPGAWGV